MNFENYIESNHQIMLGKPVVNGTRVTVELILKKFAEGATIGDIQEIYPILTKDQIYASLEYAASVISSEEILKSV